MTSVPPDVYARIEALEAQVAYLAQHLGLTPPPPPPTSSVATDFRAEIVTLIDAGRKIQAIKRYRELTGASLDGAKRAVEVMAAETRGPIS